MFARLAVFVVVAGSALLGLRDGLCEGFLSGGEDGLVGQKSGVVGLGRIKSCWCCC